MQAFWHFHASARDRVKALHFLRFLEFNVTGIIRTQVNLSHNALDPLLRGCFTYLFLSAKAMFSGDQQFVSILQSILTNFDLKAVDYDHQGSSSTHKLRFSLRSKPSSCQSHLSGSPQFHERCRQ